MNSPPELQQTQALVIGGSAGSVRTLLQILPALPTDYPLAVMIVVHLPPYSESGLVSLLKDSCRIQVKEAEDKEPIQPGKAYLAPPNYHLLVEPDFHLSLSSDEPVLFSRPSIDVLFESASDAYGNALAGLVLTGANSDGARGLSAIHSAGGRAFVQSPNSAEVATMPESALMACPLATVLDLAQISAVLTTELPALSPR
ncbi:MAG TPA: chemotaxis protein CheB [Prosthecobacter sp.]